MIAKYWCALIPLLSAVLFFLNDTSSAAKDEPPFRCQSGGIGGEPFVPDIATARAIFKAVKHAVWPDDSKKFPIIVVMDKGGYWDVGDTSRAKPKSPHLVPGGSEEIIVSAGGGTFRMEINKCTGAISNAGGIR